MSSKMRSAQYADQKGVVVEGFDGKCIIAEGATVPTDGTAGYAPGALFFKREGVAGGQLYVNEGTKLSSDFNPSGANGRVARGVATITGSGTVVTGLSTVVAVTATMASDASLTNGTAVTATIGDQAGTPAAGSVILKVWKPTSSVDGTPIASAAAVSVNWIAAGA